MRKIMITGLAIGFIALVAYSRAQAAPPDEGQYRQFNEPIIACDTRPQVDEVVQAIKDGKLPEKLRELHEQVDSANEPVCIYAPIGPVAFGDSVHIGQIHDHDRLVDTWIVHVGNQKAEFYQIGRAHV